MWIFTCVVFLAVRQPILEQILTGEIKVTRSEGSLWETFGACLCENGFIKRRRGDDNLAVVNISV